LSYPTSIIYMFRFYFLLVLLECKLRMINCQIIFYTLLFLSVIQTKEMLIAISKKSKLGQVTLSLFDGLLHVADRLSLKHGYSNLQNVPAPGTPRVLVLVCYLYCTHPWSTDFLFVFKPWYGYGTEVVLSGYA